MRQPFHSLNVPKHTIKKIKAILAYFIYELEADSYSRCQVTEGSRMVELNDYEILEITQLSEQERTYKYEV